MKYILSFLFLFLFSFNVSFSQQSEVEYGVREKLEGLSMNEIEKKLNKAITRIERAKFNVFKDKTEIVKLLDEEEANKIYLDDIVPYKNVSKEEIKNTLINIYKNIRFFQHLNSLSLSFISPSDPDGPANKMEEYFPYSNKSSTALLDARIHKLYYADGTSENCDYPLMGEIPTAKLITKMDISVGYEFLANTKKVNLSDTPEYNEGTDFFRLIDVAGNEAKFWASNKIYQKGFVTVSTKSGKTIFSANKGYSKKVEGYSEEVFAHIQELKDGMKNIQSNIIDGKYTDSKEVVDDIIKEMKGRTPDKFSKNEDMEYALSFRTDEDQIDKVNLILQENPDSMTVATTIYNADVMTLKTGVRLRAKTLLDNDGKVITELPFFRVEQELGLFFSAKKVESDKYETYLFDKQKKELVKTPYQSYMTPLGKSGKYDYDFIEVKDADTQKYGVIDLNGKIVFPTVYSYIVYEPYDRLFYLKEGIEDDSEAEEYDIKYNLGVINAEGKEILKKEYAVINMGRYFITAYDKDEYRIFDKQGRSLIKDEWIKPKSSAGIRLNQAPVIDEADTDDYSIGVNRLDEPLLLISRKNVRKLNPAYNAFFINNKGEVVLKETKEYSFHSSFYGGLAIVKKKNTLKGKDKYGYINYEGKVVIPMVYDLATPFVKGSAKVKKDGKIFYIDKLNRPSDKKRKAEDLESEYKIDQPVSVAMPF